MFNLKSKIYLFALSVLLIYVACRKTDSALQPESKQEAPVSKHRFFETHQSSNQFVKAGASFVKNQNDKYQIY